MCGLFGFVGKREFAQSIDLNAALEALHHRGPDDRGTYFGICGADADLACAMAHTRLSIIDLSTAGRQPMHAEDERFTLVYNGEIYNFRELRDELERAGVVFTSNTDSEIVLRAYVAWGAQCVERFNGMFAFAVWDRATGTLFLARDRFGIKPLYYVQLPEGFAFASEIRCLLATGVSRRRISKRGIVSYLTFGSVAHPHTIVEDAFALMPAHRATVSGGSFRAERYWSLASAASVKPSDGVESVGQLLREAVRSHLTSDVPLGVFLSGGIDSSAIVSLSSHAGGTPLHTFTMTFDETTYNEEQFAARVASHFGSDHHQIRISGGSAALELDRIFSSLDQPSSDGVNTYFVSKAAREAGLIVALSGLGGDEVFAGYDYFSAFQWLMKLGRLARFLPGVPMDSDGVHAFDHSSMRTMKLKEILRSEGRPGRVYSILREVFLDRQRRRIAPALCAQFDEESVDEGPGEAPSGDAIGLFSRLELENYLPNTLLRDVDCMSMSNSMETRVPFLDHRLVEHVVALPGRIKRGSKSNKQLLVSAVGDLPEEVVNRRKMGFLIPLDVWSRGAMRERLNATFMEASGATTLFDMDVVRHVWSSYLEGRPSITFSRVWALAVLLEWSARNRVVLE